MTSVATDPTTKLDKMDNSDISDLKDLNIAPAITAATEWLDERQYPEGYWLAKLESNSCMEAQWILAMHFLGKTDDPKYPGIVDCILHEQDEKGCWNIYYGAPNGDINTTVECYVALRAAGHDPDAPHMVKAREWIFANGGLAKLRVFSKYWLALFGLWPWEDTPQLPPEIIYVPSWAPFSIYQFAQWARATILPLAVISARRPVRPLPEHLRPLELYPDGMDQFDFSIPRKEDGGLWESLFMGIDRLLCWYAKSPVQLGRETAVKLCMEWIIKHQDGDGAWGGIQPPWVYSVLALNVEQYHDEHPCFQAGLKAWDKEFWSYERYGVRYIHACESSIWDTMLTLLAMHDSDRDVNNSPVMQKALDYLLDKQLIDIPGDWQVYVKNTRPGGWAFERANTRYPDTDDTAVALLAIARLKDKVDFKRRERIEYAIERGVEWMVGMQSTNGGYGAFDKDNHSKLITKIPFCDFGEVLDPPSVDVTAHALEAFGAIGMRKDHPAVQKAYDYIRQEQEEDGAWFGRWGVNYIYATGATLPALEAIEEDMRQDWIIKAADWLVDKQNEDGGWGEQCESYMDHSLRGAGESTASQTAWALMGLVAMDNSNYDQVINRGVKWLTSTQVDGTWDEPQYTGTGFPGYGVGERRDLDQAGQTLDQGLELARAFMIRYNYYCHYFPLAALGRARNYLAGK